jgi:hypothetical protein
MMIGYVLFVTQRLVYRAGGVVDSCQRHRRLWQLRTTLVMGRAAMPNSDSWELSESEFWDRFDRLTETIHH